MNEGEILDESDHGRPDDCDCGDWNAGDRVDLPCWPCYREGFETPNSGTTGDNVQSCHESL